MIEIKNFIAGELQPPIKANFLDNYNPASGTVYSKVPDSTKVDVDRAVEAAKNAFPAWSNTPAVDRANYLLKLADIIEDNAEKLVKAESFDQGKPEWLARQTDIPRCSANLRFFAHAIINQSSVAFTDQDGVVEYINRPAIGPCALISPWNLPLYILTWKIAPCLAAGNTAICKPSEMTPMTAFLFSELVNQSGLPAGVLNIVHGSGAVTGQALVEHPDVPVISFTGGTATGGHIAQTAGPMFKKTSLELGGKNPNIIFADCDFAKMLQTTLRSSFINQGEVCLCGSRIFVEKSIYGKFVEEFVKATKDLKVGDPSDDGNFIGALVSKSHLEKVKSYVELAKQEGGEVLAGDEDLNLSADLADGYFMRPTIITGLDYQCRVQQEEIFGPVVSITPFETEEEVLQMANSVRYGLSASLWTGDNSRAMRVSKQIKAGTVWVNSWMFRNLRAPLGGMKESGIGREGGNYSLNFFTETQNVSISY